MLQTAFPNVTHRRVLDLIEVVQRGGLTAPWLSVPALVALTTDPVPDTAAKALRVLKAVSAEPQAGRATDQAVFTLHKLQLLLLSRQCWLEHGMHININGLAAHLLPCSPVTSTLSWYQAACLRHWQRWRPSRSGYMQQLATHLPQVCATQGSTPLATRHAPSPVHPDLGNP
jgi:hypothetical protein